MKTAGFGPMASVGETDQPWSHESDGTPLEPVESSDNSPVLGPAGQLLQSQLLGR
jgi:hypothetical protein